MNGIVGKLVNYVSFFQEPHAFTCVAKLQNEEDAKEVFQIYCDHLHHNGWIKVKCDVINSLINEDAAEFTKDGETKYVIRDIFEE